MLVALHGRVRPWDLAMVAFVCWVKAVKRVRGQVLHGGRTL